jgi:GNAT superfamily N-acetyltransferase
MVDVGQPDTAALEAIEAEFMYQYEVNAPASAVETLGIATERMRGGVALSMSKDVTAYWSKALGFGFSEAVTFELVGDVLDFYRRNGAPRMAFQIAPAVLPADWEEIAAAHGLKAGHNQLKHLGRIDSLQLGSSELRIGEITPDQAREFATVQLQGFGMPLHGLVDVMTAAAAGPHFRNFAAWDGQTMVAVANLFISGDLASLNSGTTLPEYRNRGAQSGLIAARVQAAAEAGCTWVVSETGEGGPSMDNMGRVGMKMLYARRNWLWHAEPAD